jgi:predicted transcriptional regulator
MERSRKRTGLELKKEILSALNDNLEHSYAELERKVNSDWKTIRRHCKELEFFEIISFINEKIKITEKGNNFLKKNKPI